MFRYLPQISLAAGVLAGYTTIHKHLIGASSEYKRLSLHTDEEQPFDENTQNIVDELLDYFLLRLSAADVARMKLFWSNQADLVHFGTHFSRFGTYVGIPSTFGFRSRSDIDLERLAACGLSITHNNPDAMQALSDSLLLSDDARRFALARELHSLNTIDMLEKLSFLLCCVCWYQSGCMLSRFTVRQSSFVQLVCLVALIAVWVGVYYSIEGTLSVRRTVKADKRAAEMGKEYLEGGIEYISKLQQRNIALRTLQQEGQQVYTESGDVIRRLYQPAFASLSQRKRMLMKFKSESGDQLTSNLKPTSETLASVEKEKKEEKVSQGHKQTAEPHKLTAEPHKQTAETHKLTAEPHKQTAEPHKLTAEPESEANQNSGILSWITKLFV